MKKIISIFIIIATLTFAFAGCAKVNKFAPANAENLASGAVYTYSDPSIKSGKSFKMTGKRTGQVDITFAKETTINTILINETSNTIRGFEIWNADSELPELIYKQDEIDGLRYCYIDTITVKKLVLKVFTFGEKFKLNRFEAFNIKREQKDFRITTYIPVNEFLEDYAERDGIKNVTDIILFGTATYNELGDIKTDDKKIDKAIKIITDIRGENKARIYVNFVLASEIKNINEMTNEKFFASIQKMALKENKDKLANNLKDFANSKMLDGISFDYEYPYTLDDYKVYGNFLIALKQAMPNKRISIAVAPWGMRFSKKAIEAVDMFEIMAYDLMDARGNHSGWQLAAVDAIDYMVKEGIPKAKLDLGVPFYSRPVDYGNYWGSWSSDQAKMDKFANYVGDEFVVDDEWNGRFLVKGRYYNGVNLIQDKTAYAYDYGIGGMMIWHYNCDVKYSHERSLLKAMNNIFD